MPIKIRSLVQAVFISALVASGCTTPQTAPVEEKKIDYAAELPPGSLALRKLLPSQYPDFSAAITASNVKDLGNAIDQSLSYLAKPSSQAFYPYGDITQDRAVASLRALKQTIKTESRAGVSDGGKHFDSVIKNTFDVYQSVGAPDPNTGGYTGKVLFTGYVTPIYPASLTRTGPYVYPIYKRPADLVTDAAGSHAWRKLPDGSMVPYYTRREIEQNHLLDGQELVWLTDKFDAYVVAIQGSARLRLTDGSTYEIGYAGNNGFEYTSPRPAMLADRVITKEQYGLRAMRDFFRAHPEAVDKYLSVNQRFIFFSEQRGGPFGSLGVPVTTFGSIATDKSVYPRAMPAFLTVPIPSSTGGFTHFRGFALDQDTGGGIRASGRCDIYMGIGDQAEQLAGQEQQSGELYYLAVKSELAGQFQK